MKSIKSAEKTYYPYFQNKFLPLNRHVKYAKRILWKQKSAALIINTTYFIDDSVEGFREKRSDVHLGPDTKRDNEGSLQRMVPVFQAGINSSTTQASQRTSYCWK